MQPNGSGIAAVAASPSVHKIVGLWITLDRYTSFGSGGLASLTQYLGSLEMIYSVENAFLA